MRISRGRRFAVFSCVYDCCKVTIHAKIRQLQGGRRVCAVLLKCAKVANIGVYILQIGLHGACPSDRNALRVTISFTLKFIVKKPMDGMVLCCSVQ